MPFAGIVGHRRLLSLLTRAIARGTLPPSLLLAGPRGIGKRMTATAIATTLNCLHPRPAGAFETDACGECQSCRRIARGVHPDVVVVEPGDLGTISIEAVREVIDRANYRPFEGRRRVVIVDEADALMPQAQNALLKTLEEPPSASVFVLVSSMADALLPTVRSRCRPLRFGELATAEVAEVLIRDHQVLRISGSSGSGRGGWECRRGSCGPRCGHRRGPGGGTATAPAGGPCLGSRSTAPRRARPGREGSQGSRARLSCRAAPGALLPAA